MVLDKNNNNIPEKWHIASIQSPELERGPDYLNWKVYYSGWMPCMDWCREQFDIDDDNQPRTWRYVGEGVFEFKNEQDRTLFLLRWA